MTLSAHLTHIVKTNTHSRISIHAHTGTHAHTHTHTHTNIHTCTSSNSHTHICRHIRVHPGIVRRVPGLGQITWWIVLTKKLRGHSGEKIAQKSRNSCKLNGRGCGCIGTVDSGPRCSQSCPLGSIARFHIKYRITSLLSRTKILLE